MDVGSLDDPLHSVNPWAQHQTVCRRCFSPAVAHITDTLSLAAYIFYGVLCQACYERQEREQDHA